MILHLQYMMGLSQPIWIARLWEPNGLIKMDIKIEINGPKKVGVAAFILVVIFLWANPFYKALSANRGNRFGIDFLAKRLQRNRLEKWNNPREMRGVRIAGWKSPMNILIYIGKIAQKCLRVTHFLYCFNGRL